MKKILFDASVHLGQFNIKDEKVRIWCKNSQAAISAKGDGEVAGLYTFNENGWMDKIIWGFDRETQDTFYPFMDVFYSVKNIIGAPFSMELVRIIQNIRRDLSVLEDQNIMTCATAILLKIDEIHTAYPALLQSDVVEYMKSNCAIVILGPTMQEELVFQNSSQGDLEKLYQESLRVFRKNNVDVGEYLHE
jgi:hypothetical protein